MIRLIAILFLLGTANAQDAVITYRDTLQAGIFSGGPDTVILLHGGGFTQGSKSDMYGAAGVIRQSGFTVIVPDYRKGHAALTYGCDTSASFIAAALRAYNDIAGLCDTLHLRRAYFAGWSAGAWLAFSFAHGVDFSPWLNLGELPAIPGVQAAGCALYSTNMDTTLIDTTATLMHWGSTDTISPPVIANPCGTFYGQAPAFAALTGCRDSVVSPGGGHQPWTFEAWAVDVAAFFALACQQPLPMATGDERRPAGGEYKVYEIDSRLIFSGDENAYREWIAAQEPGRVYIARNGRRRWRLWLVE